MTPSRDDLDPRLRAVSDALDEYLGRLIGVYSSWSYPAEFIEFLEKRGFTVVRMEAGQDE